MSSSFVGALVTRKLDGDCAWEVAEAFEYHVGHLGSAFRIQVPANFPTDGASIPRFLWPLWPPFGGFYDQAAGLHDFLYKMRAAEIERVLADAIFLEAMTVLVRRRLEQLDQQAAAALVIGWRRRLRRLRAGAWYHCSRWCIYLGVRVGGWWTYRKYRRAIELARGRAAG